MRAADLGKLMPNPALVCECAAMNCSNQFKLKDGWAFPGHGVDDQSVRMYFFCDAVCFLAAMPVEACYRC